MPVNYGNEDLETLKSDLNSLIGLVHKIDRKYAKGDKDTYHYIKKVRQLIDRFNGKYHGIHAALKKTNLNLMLRIFMRNDSTKETFNEFFSEQPDIKERIFKNHINLDMEVEPIMDKTYLNPVEDTLALKKDPHRNMVEIIYREESLSNINSPEFKLLAKHALHNYHKKIDLRSDIDDIFCFDFDDNEEEEDDLVYRQKKNSDEVVY